MDIIELLVLLAFILFPLLQALLEKMGVGQRPEPPSPAGEAEDEAGEVAVERAPVRASADVPEEANWSSGWGSWPGEQLEELAAEEVVTEEEADELIAYQERLSQREATEAARTTVPVVSMEPLEVDRAAEHRRFHERVVTKRPPRAPAPSERLHSLLSDQSEIRRAVLLSEILGPPRSLRSDESAGPR